MSKSKPTVPDGLPGLDYARAVFRTTSAEETVMEWTKPEFEDMRFGFEITMYIFAR